MSGQKTVKIFIMEQEFPCGEQSSCCGPIGQSAEEIDSLKSSIEKQLGYEVEVLNVKSDDDMRDYPQIVQLFQSLGPAALPILAFEDEVVSMGDSTPEKVVPAIRENTEKKNFGKEDKMHKNDNSEQTGSKESTSDMQPCCSSTSDTGCCPSGTDGGGGKSWKTLVFVLIVVAAGAVLARSLIKKSDSTTDQTPQGFATMLTEENDEASSQANTMAKVQTSDRTEPTLWGPELDSLDSLGKVLPDTDAVFILLAAEDQLKTQHITKEVEAAAKKVQSGGTSISAFTLKKDTRDYARLARRYSVPSVLAMVKGRSIGVASGDITESKLIQAFVKASRPRSGCGPGGCGPGGCGPARSR
jgi:hypothetical protein